MQWKYETMKQTWINAKYKPSLHLKIVLCFAFVWETSRHALLGEAVHINVGPIWSILRDGGGEGVVKIL